MHSLLKASRLALLLLLGAAAVSLLAAVGTYLYLAPELPSIERLKDVRFQVPLRIYGRDGALLAEFGDKKRAPVRYEDVPPAMIQAVVAAEDDRFFEHPGVDYQGILRAAVHLARTGEKGQGGSTITMQVARNFFLSAEKTYLRKLREILLAFKIERQLSKEEILELYLNKIYLGNRAYGVGAAAQVYYGKPLDELTIPQIAMIAGLPKAPSRYNPIADPKRALIRRDYVLERMFATGALSEARYREARASPVTAELHGQDIAVDAPYVAEMVRKEVTQRYGREAYHAGYQVFTTIDADRQAAANQALRKALLDYDQRHGYRGPEDHVDLAPTAGLDAWQTALEGREAIADLHPGVIVDVTEKQAVAFLGDDELVEIPWSGLVWARPLINQNHRGPVPRSADQVVSRGDIVRVRQDEEGWRLSQVPEAQGALVSLNPENGGILALVGGFDFQLSKFNRATQSARQPGSNFKPFLYSAALANGFTPASIINDAPIVFQDAALEGAWRPENYSGRFHGPTRLREALVHSRNLVSIRLLRAIGVDAAIEHVSRFGFPKEALPRNLSLSLGSGGVTPHNLAGAYAVFANGGYRVTPHVMARIEGPRGELLWKANPARVCEECQTSSTDKTAQLASRDEREIIRPAAAELAPVHLAERAISPQNAYLMTTMMRDVIQRGTGRRARQLGRNDLAGKTGTTNDQRDAWFSGFNTSLVTTAWVGFDNARPLGQGETGARAALPMWLAYMDKALAGLPERPLPQPPGLVTVRIDPETGLLATGNNPDAVFETFRTGHLPEEQTSRTADNDDDSTQEEPDEESSPKHLF